MSELNGFERTVKEALEPYEVPYNSADWSHLERVLDGRSDDVARVSRSGLYALLLGGSLAAASSFFVLVAPGTAPEHGMMAQTTTAQQDTTPVQAPPATNDQNATITTEQLHSAPVAVAVEVGTKAPSPTGNTSLAGSGTVATGPTPAAPGHPAGNARLVKPSITEGCPGSVVVFEAADLAGDGKYLWNFGDGSFSNKPKPSHTFGKPGSFEVTLSYSSPAGGGIRNEAVADRIIIHEAPEAAFSTLKQEYDNTVPSVHFENRSLGGKTYLWDFGDGTTSTVAHPDHVYKKAGLYTVSLTVANANGCEDRTERTVSIDADYDLMAAKTFSPNGDGVDDVFIPEALKTLGVRFHLSIFETRTGGLVYETGDPQRPWNGRVYNKGEASPAGDYLWMVEMKDGEKLGGTYNGSIQLVR